MTPPISLPDGHRVLSGPTRARSENLWVTQDADGSSFVFGQLLPELARDEALRRRYVRDAERRADLRIEGLAQVVALGPQPDPRDPTAAAPWRLREHPHGPTLAAVLDERAPLPVDEAIHIAIELASVVHAAHQAGIVFRDLEPRNIVLTNMPDSGGGDISVCLTDIGLARVDILSTRSASSLMLEGSPYAAPEHLRATVLDSRADIYTIAVVLWQALTGDVPFSSSGSMFRERARLPLLEALAINAPPGLDELIEACLAEDPSDRPESARDVVDILRGNTAMELLGSQSNALEFLACQSCGERMRPGLRLCLSCGKEAVQYRHASVDDEIFELRLIKATEDAEFLAKLRSFFEAIGEGPPPELNFLIGDSRLYSRAERERLHKLPATLLVNLSRATADALAARLEADGFKVKVVRTRIKPAKTGKRMLLGGLIATAGGLALSITGTVAVGLPLLLVGATIATIGGVVSRRTKTRKSATPLIGLREAPAALPASDPLIARLGSLLQSDLADDSRERIEEIALLVQRLVDHRAAQVGDEDFARLTEPIEPLIDLIEAETLAIAHADQALAELDEGKLVRAIASSEARGEPRNVRVELYTGLDRLRDLEDQRAQHMERLLEASSLMRRTVNLGLAHKSDEAETSRAIALALAALEA